MSYKQQIGKWGEQLAAEYLTTQGYQIVAQNYFTRYGELDLIAKEKAEYVFVEVKTRSSQAYGKPREAIHKFKQKNLILTARLYLQEHGLTERDWRIDVIEVLINAPSAERINHIPNAVSYF